MNVLERVIAFIADQNVDAYFVGGLVRDELLGRAVKRDIDLAVDGDASNSRAHSPIRSAARTI